MTIDDDKSIYVGGLPYECTESQLRRAFELYGSIVAVKIINDRGVGGRCYGFVTFKNPRSAVASIRDMDGRTIGGRVVRVNEVKNRDRSNLRRDRGRPHHRIHERSIELSSESGDYEFQMEEELDILIKRREELQVEKSDMEQRLEEKKRLIADLEKRSQKLEDLLTSAKKQSSGRQMQLTKLHKCFQEVKECGERLKSSEVKLQDLVDSASMEIDAGDEIIAKDACLTNGKL